MLPGFLGVDNVCLNSGVGLLDPWQMVAYGDPAHGLWMGMAYGLWIELAILVIGALAVWRPLPRGGVITIGAVAIGAVLVSGLYAWTGQRNADVCFASYPPSFNVYPLIAALVGRSNTALDLSIAAFLIATALTAWLVVAGGRRGRSAGAAGV